MSLRDVVCSQCPIRSVGVASKEFVINAKWGRVTSSGLMKTEMDFPGFSVTSCWVFFASRSFRFADRLSSDRGDDRFELPPRHWSSSVSRDAALACSIALRKCSAGSERTDDSLRACSMAMSSLRCSSMLHCGIK